MGEFDGVPESAHTLACMSSLSRDLSSLQGGKTEKIKSNAAAVYQNAIQIFDQIIESRSIDDAHLRLIIDSIVVGANSDVSLDVDISLKAPFLNSIKDVDTIDDLTSFMDVSKNDVSKWKSPDMQSWEEVKNAFLWRRQTAP